MTGPQVSNWYACPEHGPVDPIRRPVRMSLRGNLFVPEYELVCPRCGEKVEVKC
jgi:hypothetical protein